MIVAISLSSPLAKAPFACSQTLIEQSRRANLSPPYAPRGKFYCDGAAAAKHSGRLAVRSITRGPVSFGSERLDITFENDLPFFVRGWDLRPSGTYRLDGDLSDGKVSVDIGAALGPMGLQAEDLGLYAWRKEGISQVYAPITAGSSGPILVKVHSAARLREVRFVSFCPETANECGTRVSASSSNNEEGAQIDIELPADAESGRYRLTIVAAGTAAGDFPTGSFDIDL